jgi:hypothetical protein
VRREGLELVGTDFIHESVTFSPSQGSRLVHVCFRIVRGPVYSRVGGVLLALRQVGTLVHGCLGIVGSRVHTSVGEGWF